MRLQRIGAYKVMKSKNGRLIPNIEMPGREILLTEPEYQSKERKIKDFKYVNNRYKK